jgi:hypothetical protein
MPAKASMLLAVLQANANALPACDDARLAGFRTRTAEAA